MAARVTPTVAVQIVANLVNFGSTLAKASKDLNAFQKQLSGIQNKIIGAFAAERIASFGIELAKLGGESQAVTAAFRRLEDSSRLMTELKNVTGGTVSELELMKRTVQAANFGISLKQLPELFKFAALRAQQTGQSVDYLVESIIMGIGRKSPMILDNLGISLVRLRDKLGGVGSEAASVAQFTKIVGDIAKEELSKMPGFAENAATSIARIDAAWYNMKVNIGDSGFFKSVMSGFASIVMAMEGWTKKMESVKLTDEIEEINLLVRSITDSNIHQKARLELIKELDAKYPNFLGNLKEEKVTNEQLKSRLEDVNAQYSRKIQMVAAEESMAEASKKVLNILRDQAELQKVLDRLKSQRGKETTVGYGGMPRLDAEKTLESDIKRTEKAILQMNNKIEDAIREEADLMKNFEQVLDQFNKGAKNMFASTNQNVAQTVDLTKKKLDELEKKLSSSNLKIDLKSLFPKTVFEQAKEELAEEGKRAQLAFVKSFMDGKIEVPKWMQEMIDKIRDAQQKIKQEAQEFKISIKKQFTEGSLAILQDFFNAFEQIGAGELTFGQNIINAISNFMKLFGQQLIALGVAGLGLKKFLDNIFSKSPAGAIAAIAAGTALVSLAGAMRAKNQLAIQKTVRTAGVSDTSSNLRTMDSIRLEVTGRLTGQGKDLIAVIDNANFDNRFRKGG